MRDHRTQVTLGLFLATFVYALVALREVRGTDIAPPDQTFVPGVTLSVAFALVLADVGVFVQYIGHIVQLVRVENILHRIAEETRATIARVHPPDAPAEEPPSPPGEPVGVVAAPHPGIVTSLDEDDLVEQAAAAGVVLVLTRRVGEFVPEGAPLLQVHGDEEGARALDPARLCTHVTLRHERTGTEDVAYGLRQLVDIAERALSPGVNDPTTAAQALDQVHDLLRRLAVNPLAGGVHRDDRGRVRLLVPRMTWDDYLSLGLDEIRHWGAGSLQVQRRLRDLLLDLLDVVDERRAPAVQAQLRLLDERAEGELPAPELARLRAP